MGSHSALRPKGFMEKDGQVVAETLQCCHCGGHFLVTPGSGKTRGFCLKCGSVTCGDARCDACLPTEAWLDNVEAGRPENYRRIFTALPVNPLASD